MKPFIITLVAGLLIGAFVGWSLHPNAKLIKPDTLIEYRYTEKTDTLIVPKFKTITKSDTIKYLDTIFVHNEIQYIAEVDTFYQDSTLSAKIQYVSPIPLSSKSYFNLDFKTRETIITNTVVQVEEVYMPRRLSLGVGIVASLSNPVVAKVLGNITYKPIDTKWFEMPLTTEVQYDDKLEFYFRAEGKIKF